MRFLGYQLVEIEQLLRLLTCLMKMNHKLLF